MAKLLNRRTFLHLSGSGVAMPMVARVALGAAIITEQKHE